MEQKPKIVCVTGPTCSGKTDFAIAIAKEFNGEIISADSRQIFKDVWIVSNKPYGEKQDDILLVDGVPHHLIDFVEPTAEYTLYNWIKDAKKCIETILSKNKLPIIAGGTPMYISAITDGYDLETRGKNNPEYDSLLLYISVPRDVLYKNMDNRVHTMIKQGAIKEAQEYLDKYGEHHFGMSKTSQGYNHLFSYIRGEIPIEKAIYEMQKDTRHYAKRQETWWRHHGNPISISSYEDARSLVSRFLGKK